MAQSLNNYYVGKKVRDITQRPGIANMQLLDHCMPVAVINPSNSGVEVQPSLPKPNSNQVLKTYMIYNTNSNVDVTIATPSSTKKYYYLGFIFANDGASAQGSELCIKDSATAGNITTNGSTVVMGVMTAKVGTQVNYSSFVPLPIMITTELKVYLDQAGATGSNKCVIFYIEETVTPTI